MSRRIFQKLQRSISHEMSSYSSLNKLIPQSESTNGATLEEGKPHVTSSLLRDTGQNRPTHSSFSPKFIRVFFAFLIFALLIFTFAIATWYHWKNAPCTSKSCVMTSSRILRNIDWSTSPCDDFYQFSCGNWINQSVNLKFDSWNMLYETQTKAHDKIVNAIGKIIDETFPVPLNSGEKATAVLFKQCTDLEKLQQIGISTWKRFVDEIGGFLPELISGFQNQYISDDTEIEDVILTSFNYSVFALFWAGVEVNERNSSEYIISIYEQMPLLLRPELYTSKIEVTPEKIFNRDPDLPQVLPVIYEIAEDIAKLLNYDVENEDVRMMLANLIHLDYAITVSGMTAYKNKNQKDRYEIVTINDLQKIAPVINWRYFLSTLLGTQLKSHEQIALKTGVEWIAKLSRIIENLKRTREGVAIVKNYVKLKLIFFHLSYVSPKNNDGGTLWNAVRIYSGDPNKRKEFCILRLSGIFPLSLPSILRKLDGTAKSDENKRMVEEMAENIRMSYKNVLENGETLKDEKTRDLVVQKISNATIHIGYPDKMLDDNEMNREALRLGSEFFWSMVFGASTVYREKLNRLREPVQSGDWLDTFPAISLPVHNHERNMIQIPFDAMRWPYADTEQMEFANYAGVGSQIGHELTHGFDSIGRLHGPTGNLGLAAWYSPESARAILQKEQCFINQYASLSGGRAADAANGLYENVADHVGLRVTYEAWRDAVAADRRAEKMVGGLEEMTQDQLFFVAYAQGWCALKANLVRGVHMEEKIRILGSLQNSPEFAKAWKCPADSFMNPRTKCNFW